MDPGISANRKNVEQPFGKADHPNRLSLLPLLSPRTVSSRFGFAPGSQLSIWISPSDETTADGASRLAGGRKRLQALVSLRGDRSGEEYGFQSCCSAFVQ